MGHGILHNFHVSDDGLLSHTGALEAVDME
jgi:hypothetical protein